MLRNLPERTEFDMFGYLASFDTADELLEEIARAKANGFQEMEAYTPYPSHEISEALQLKNRRLPLYVLIGGIFGACVGFGLQYWTSVIEYPMNVGGRPFNSWPSFIVVTFETTILFAALTAVLGMFFLNGLPQPYHPVFHIEEFQQASRNRFFLLLLSRDPRFVPEEAKTHLEAGPALAVHEVPR